MEGAELYLLRYIFECDTMRDRDMLIWEMHESGMRDSEIADALEISLIRARGAIGRVEAGRYNGE